MGARLVVCAVFCLWLQPAARAADANFPQDSSSQPPAQSSPKPPEEQNTKEQKPPAADQNAPSGQSGSQPSQPAPGSAQAPGGTPGQTPSNAPGSPPQSGTSSTRLFWALPNFSTVESSTQLPPLTAGQKFKLVARGMFDPAEFVWVGLITGIDQASNANPTYGQGAAGFGLRYGTNFGDTLTENFMVGAVLPSLLRQDPRYYQLGKGGFFHRTVYAISRIFVTRSDSGRTQFNSSEIFGSALAAGISTYSYHPHSERNLGDVAGVWGTQLTSDAAAFMLKEFWPDLRRMFHKKRAS